MQFKSVPSIDPRYWAALTLASVFGANTGDFAARILHLGHVNGLPYLAAIFVAIVLAERKLRWEGWYWLAIVTVRTAATNLADLAAHDSKFGNYPVALALVVLLAALLLIRRTRVADTAALPRTDPLYWLAMLTAGTLGTALGDGFAGDLTLQSATILTGILVALALAMRARPFLAVIATYWLAVVAVRTFGTNLGDLLAHDLGLSTSTVLSFFALAALLAVWRSTPQRAASTA